MEIIPNFSFELMLAVMEIISGLAVYRKNYNILNRVCANWTETLYTFQFGQECFFFYNLCSYKTFKSKSIKKVPNFLIVMCP